MILICWRSVILEKYHQQAWQRSQAPKCAAMGNHLDPIMVFLLKMTTCYPLSRACDSAMALGLPDVLSVKNVVHAFFPGSASWKNHILYILYRYTIPGLSQTHTLTWTPMTWTVGILEESRSTNIFGDLLGSQIYHWAVWVDVELQLVSCCIKQEVRSKNNDKMRRNQTESSKQLICFHGA